MKYFKEWVKYFTKGELLLWIFSCALIIASFFIFDRENYLTLIASLIGVSSLIYNAKGNPFGQLLMIVFSVFYGIISFGFSYYGEMITYLGMTAPMALVALIAWLKNPYDKSRNEVKVNRIVGGEVLLMLLLTALVTVIFYFILAFFGTANIIPSTVSVSSSFAAAYLTFRRSPYFALAYALNDLILIILWSLAASVHISYISVIICFIAFLANDLYGFFSWLKMEKRQSAKEEPL